MVFTSQEHEMAHQVVKWFDDAPTRAQQRFLDRGPDDLAIYHFSLGMEIRNHFELWKQGWTPVLNDKGEDSATDHPDAISMRVIHLAWNIVNERNA